MIDVTRSSEIPASLQSTNHYNGEDVLEQLREDFLGKCYLCEGPLPGLGFQVDHLRPKAGFPELRLAWPNLFPAHADSCNQRRLKWSGQEATHNGQKVEWPVEGLLDCSDPNERAEARLLQRFELGAGPDIEVYISASDPRDRRAANTARELQHILGDKDNRHARQHRALIHGQYSRVQQAWGRMIKALFEKDDSTYEQRRDELARLLSRGAPYAALLRTYMRQEIPTQFHARLGLDA